MIEQSPVRPYALTAPGGALWLIHALIPPELARQTIAAAPDRRRRLLLRHALIAIFYDDATCQLWPARYCPRNIPRTQ